MSVNQFTINFPGQNNITPRLGHLYAPNNTLSQVTAAGYLDAYLQAYSFSVLSTDIIQVAASDGNQFYKPVFTNGSCQLTALP